MKICNLASGSKGNATFVATDKYRILIDLGKNKKYIVDKLAEIGEDYKKIDYVFLSHTHDDHTSAIKTFLKGHSAKLVLTSQMYKELGLLEGINVILYDNQPQIDGLEIKTFKMSHDSGDIRSFLIVDGDSSFVLVTDTGYINSRYFKELSNRNVYYIESNHDVEMLKHGPYPEWLQSRVLSDVGHLSNNFAGIYLSKLISSKTSNILLLHLSEKNNTEQCALDTVCDALKDIDTSDLSIKCSKQNEVSEVIVL